MLINSSIAIILTLINAIIIKRSNRKRKYGIFPGRISLILISLLSSYYFTVIIVNTTNQSLPVLVKHKKEEALEIYQKELNEYINNYNTKEKNLATHFKYIHYLYSAVIIQGFIALLLAIYGLITIPRRRKFYWIISISYVLVLSILVIGNWLLE